LSNELNMGVPPQREEAGSYAESFLLTTVRGSERAFSALLPALAFFIEQRPQRGDQAARGCQLGGGDVFCPIGV
jgi:hypothetical protein